ncbi:Npt1/Npt2 family nucleotide transporter [Namhaeicola litoreus]|uniref:Npt1/Npt2 family nucleotide transporter n=1 Tax=Namhaeicola litoreus TaxID=1052145 RepID=A0ABW3XZH9_9FLAO
MVKRFLKKTFNLHEGELKVSLLMQLYIFLVITVLLMVKPSVNAIFLSQLGPENLPYAYLLVALIAVLSSIFYNKLVERYSIKIMAIASIIIFSSCFFLLSFVIKYKVFDAWILYFYYLSLSLFAVLVTSQFWIIANMVYDVREAKRLFGFIGAGAIAGGIFGGYLTTFLANFFGAGMVVFIAAILLACCIPIIFIVWEIKIKKISAFDVVKRKSPKSKVSKSSWKVVFSSKHLTLLSAIMGISVLVAKLVDYQFSDFSHKAYTNADDLSSFFGFWFSTFNVVALFVQLFLTNRLLSFLGVTGNLLILPLGIAVGCVLFLFFPELWVLVLIKGVDGSCKQSVNKAAFELSILPIDFDIKKQAKPFIDVVIDSIATGLAGFMLLFVIKELNVSPKIITLIILVSLFVWVVLIVMLRSTYFDSFRENIKASIEAANKKNSKKSKRKLTKSSIKEILSEGEEKEIISLLKHDGFPFIKVFKSQMINLIDHPSNRVKAAAIREISGFKNKITTQKIRELLDNSTDDEVVFEALSYIFSHAPSKENQLFKSYLDHEQDYKKNAALLFLAISGRNNPSLSKKFELDRRIEEQITEFTDFEHEQRWEEIAALLITIGYAGNKKYYPFIDKYLKSKNSDLQNMAIKATGLTLSEQFVPKLIDLSTNKTLRKNVVEALKNYGPSITKKLMELEASGELDEFEEQQIPEIIGSFHTKNAHQTLLRLLRSRDATVRSKAAYFLDSLEEKNEKFEIPKKLITRFILNESAYFRRTIRARISIEKAIKENAKDASNKERENLLKEINNQLHRSVETIFNLLSLKFENSDMQVAFQGIINEMEESRINSIEFLDNLLSSDLRRVILPLLEYQYLPGQENDIKVAPIDEDKCLNELLRTHGSATSLKVLQLIKEKGGDKFKRELLRLKKNNHGKINKLVNEILSA